MTIEISETLEDQGVRYHVAQEAPDPNRWRLPFEAVCTRDAEAVADALGAALPQGTLHELLVILLRRASAHLHGGTLLPRRVPLTYAVELEFSEQTRADLDELHRKRAAEQAASEVRRARGE